MKIVKGTFQNEIQITTEEIEYLTNAKDNKTANGYILINKLLDLIKSI